MSGKSKQQRTKGNVKPASSARTAELLASQSSALSGIGGLPSTTLFGFAAPGAKLSDQTDEVDNPEMRLIFKKLSKRDAATKLKALQELKQLCQSISSDDIVKALPYWPRLFNRLAIDIDRRVREATHCAHEQMCVRAGRQLAAHLKVIVPCWLCTMCDPHLPAAKAAQTALAATLPNDVKRADAFVFCKDAIFNYITENLFEHTPSSLSDPKSTSPEDMQSKYERVVATSLLAVGHLLQQLLSKQKTAFSYQLDALFSQSKLWKYGKSKVLLVRLAVYKMIVAACEHIPEIVTAHAGSVCPVALVAIGETDRVVCSAAWEAALHALTKIEGCWSYVNIQKAVLPKIWSFLKDGGGGSADLIYPNLLPLIDLLPESVVAGGDFYLQFFSNMKKGLESSVVEQSSTACGSIISSFFECLRYALSHGKIQQTDTSCNVRKSLLCDQLLGIVQMSMFELTNTSQYSAQLLYPPFANLIGYLARSQQLPSEFWAELGLIATKALNKLRLDDIERIDSVKYFFRELSALCDGLEPTSSTDAAELHQIVQEAFKSCQHLAFEQESASHLSLLACIIQSTTNPAFLLCTPKEIDNQNAIFDFVDSHLVPYLKQSSLNLSGFDTGLDILFALLSYSSEAHICQTLNVLVKAKDGVPIILSAFNMLKSPSSPVLTEAIGRWLRDDLTKACVVATAQKLTHMGDQQEQREQDNQVEEVSLMTDKMWMLVELAIASPDPLLTTDCTLEVLTLFGQFLDGLTNSDRQEGMVCQTTLKILHLLQVRFETMATYLEDYDFHLACKVFHLLGHNWSSVDSVWKTAVRAVQQLGMEEAMVKTLCNRMKDKVLCCDSTDLAIGLAYQASQLFQSIAETSITSAALRDMLPTVQAWTKWRESYQLKVIAYRPFICGAINISVLHRSDVLNMKQANIEPVQDHKHICWSVFSAKLVLGDSNEESLHPMSPIELSLMALEDVKNLSLELLWQLQVILNSGNSHKSVEKLTTLLQTGSRKLLHHIAHEQQIDDLFYLARHRSSEVGGIWAQVLGSLFTFCLSEELAFDSAMHTSFMCSKHKLSAYELHSLQMLAISLEESSPSEKIIPSVTSPAEALSQQLLTSPVAASLFEASAATHPDACLSGLSLVNCSLRLGCKFESVDCRPVTSQIVDQLIVWRDNSDAFLFDSSVVCASSVQLGFNTETCRFLSWAVRHFPSVLIDQHWEFILCGVISWLQTCSEGFGDVQLVQALGYQALTYHVFQLLAAVAECFQSLQPSSADIIPSKIASDWQEYFSETAYDIALAMFLSMAEKPSDEELPYSNHLMVCAMTQAIIQCPVQYLRGALVKNSKGVTEASVVGYTTRLSENMTKYSSLLMNKRMCVQAGSYECLKKVIPLMVELDTVKLQSEDDSNQSASQAEPDAANVSLPESLLAVIKDTSVVVTNLLRLAEGEQSSIPEQLSHIQLESGCIAYCLCWLLILDCFKKANHQLRVHYSQSVKDNGQLRDLMRVLFSLMPDGKKSSQSALQGFRLSSWDSLPSTGHVNFWQWTQPEANKAADLVEHLSCHVYFRCLQQLPALVRQWYSSADKKTSLAVEMFTSQFISPLIAQQELTAIQECNYKSDNMQIRVRHSAREVVATYTVGDVSIELIVALSSSHPLSPVKVECGRRVGVPQAQWRNWMLQLTTFLSHQNGTILDGLVLWKDNLDKKFSGLDDCMICFSVIHGSNCSIPTLQCRTCKKKFHSACLYKWFNTSNMSSCPLCRNLF